MLRYVLVLFLVCYFGIFLTGCREEQGEMTTQSSATAEYIIKKNHDYFDWFCITLSADEDTTFGFVDERSGTAFRASYASFYTTNEAFGKYFLRGYKDSMELQHYLSSFNVEFVREAGDSLYFLADSDEGDTLVGYVAGYKY